MGELEGLSVVRSTISWRVPDDGMWWVTHLEIGLMGINKPKYVHTIAGLDAR